MSKLYISVIIFSFMFSSSFVANAQTKKNENQAQTSLEEIMQQEFERSTKKINELFQEKIEKINARQALPEEMRRLLIAQSDEIRNFDIETLKKKMALKMTHAKARDELKERLRIDVQNRVQWQIEEEERFEKEKKKREHKENEIKASLKKENDSQTSAPVKTQKATQKTEVIVTKETKKITSNSEPTVSVKVEKSISISEPSAPEKTEEAELKQEPAENTLVKETKTVVIEREL